MASSSSDRPQAYWEILIQSDRRVIDASGDLTLKEVGEIWEEADKIASSGVDGSVYEWFVFILREESRKQRQNQRENDWRIPEY